MVICKCGRGQIIEKFGECDQCVDDAFTEKDYYGNIPHPTKCWEKHLVDLSREE